MHAKNILDRKMYETDADFERVLDRVAQTQDAAGKRQLMFGLGLMRDCRGCGQAPVYDSTERAYRNHCWQMVCRNCGHMVALPGLATHSIGRTITLWNTTGLLIEANQ